jgi:hypothetical protein
MAIRPYRLNIRKKGMQITPRIHHRKSIRLKGYDYSQNGAYFTTICTLNRQSYFLTYPELEEIVWKQWEKLPERFADLFLDEFAIMPDHIHGIIIVGAGLAPALADLRQTQDLGQAQDLPLRWGRLLGHLSHYVFMIGWHILNKRKLMRLGNSGNVIIMSTSSATRRN